MSTANDIKSESISFITFLKNVIQSEDAFSLKELGDYLNSMSPEKNKDGGEELSQMVALAINNMDQVMLITKDKVLE